VPSARILLVEDDPFIRELLLETLLDAKFEVIEAGDGEEAVAMLERNGFALLLTDVHLPGRFSGVDVARHARARQPELPVVFATGRPEVLSGFGRLGEREVCLVKPFAPSEALQIVKRMLRWCTASGDA
jgi:DNA-binding response OmpR family regulator